MTLHLVLCHHHHYLVLEHLHHPERKSSTVLTPKCLPTAHPTPSPGKHECAFVSVDLPILDISYKGAVTYVLSVSNLFLLAKCVYFSLHSKNQYHFCPHNQVLDLTSSLNLCVSPLIPDI